MAEKLIRIGAVENRVGFRKSKLYQMVADKRFPCPLKIDGVSVWVASEVDAFIAEQIAKRETAHD